MRESTNCFDRIISFSRLRVREGMFDHRAIVKRVSSLLDSVIFCLRLAFVKGLRRCLLIWLKSSWMYKDLSWSRY